ncbi:hypothetical protein ACFYYY_16240 [Streptomyces sp. NPDC001834]|uniref:hypothetical protein n=1 Tax=Streptomyces sp. NPDC001834 TaxID=3364616 RepID=UPI0036B6809C
MTVLEDHRPDAGRVAALVATAAGHLRHLFEFLVVGLGADHEGEERHRALGVGESFRCGDQTSA